MKKGVPASKASTVKVYVVVGAVLPPVATVASCSSRFRSFSPPSTRGLLPRVCTNVSSYVPLPDIFPVHSKRHVAGFVCISSGFHCAVNSPYCL